jgi:hypothetical protein
MRNFELAMFIAELIMENQEVIQRAFDSDDIETLRDEIYETLENMD